MHLFPFSFSISVIYTTYADVTYKAVKFHRCTVVVILHALDPVNASMSLGGKCSV